MNCKHVQNNLSAYLDRELSGGEMLEVRAHLNTCSHCRAEEQELRALKALLGGMPTPEPTRDFEERLLLTTRAQKQSHPRGWGRSFAAFTLVAICSMAVTLSVLNRAEKSQESALKQEHASEIASAIKRDQVFTASMDPYGAGTIPVPVGSYGR